MDKFVELANVEINEYCLLNITKNSKEFYKEPKQKGFTGLFFKDSNTFLGLYPTLSGPRIYFRGKEYAITPEVDIELMKSEKNRTFIIPEYEIQIDYIESAFLNWDAWSEEADVDLFYMLRQSYKEADFYNKFTLKI